MININIRTYQQGDYAAIINLWKAAGLPYKPEGRDSRSRLESEMKRGNGTFLFAVKDKVDIGVVLVTHDGRKGWINRLAVVPKYRRNGIGNRLVNEAEQWLDHQGIEIYACLIESYNEASFLAFQKMGYIPFEGVHYLTKRKFPNI